MIVKIIFEQQVEEEIIIEWNRIQCAVYRTEPLTGNSALFDTVQPFFDAPRHGLVRPYGIHRLVKGFVLQGGSADTRASGPNHPADRWVSPIKTEFRPT